MENPRPKRAIYGAAGLLVLLILTGVWLTYRREQPHNVSAPVRLAPVRPVEHLLPQPPPEPLPASPPVTTTNAAPANAADIYRKAFALLDALSPDDWKVVADWKAEVDPAVSAELCAKLQPITTLAHEAAAVTNCDWGLSNAVDESRMSLLTQSRKLARPLVWNAAHCRQGDDDGMSDDLEATVRLGENISQLLIGHLVNTAIQGIAMDFVAARAGTMDGEAAARLSELFENWRYEEAFFRALESEAEFANVKANEFSAQIQQNRSELPGGAEVPLGTRDQAVAAFRQVVELERGYARALSLPEEQYQAWLDRLHSAQQENPIVKFLWPALDNVLDSTRATVVRRAMVVAGLALAQGKPDALQNHPDPASGGAFAYRQTVDGFELESLYQLKGKPVVSSFQTP